MLQGSCTARGRLNKSGDKIKKNPEIYLSKLTITDEICWKFPSNFPILRDLPSQNYPQNSAAVDQTPPRPVPSKLYS
jgi:hypothetical protein